MMNKGKRQNTVKSAFYIYVSNGQLDFHSFSFIFVIIGVLGLICGTAYTWYDGFDKPPFSNRLGPMIMGFGIFIALCGITFMLEVKDSKNRHFIIGDCYNNFLYNTDQSITHQANRKLTVLPTILSTMQAQLTQRDHDNLIKQKIEQDNQPEKSTSDTQKKRAAYGNKRKSIDWADRACRQCVNKRVSEQQSFDTAKKGGILRQRTNPETSSIQSASTNNDDNTIS